MTGIQPRRYRPSNPFITPEAQRIPLGYRFEPPAIPDELAAELPGAISRGMAEVEANPERFPVPTPRPPEDLSPGRAYLEAAGRTATLPFRLATQAVAGTADMVPAAIGGVGALGGLAKHFLTSDLGYEDPGLLASMREGGQAFHAPAQSVVDAIFPQPKELSEKVARIAGPVVVPMAAGKAIGAVQKGLAARSAARALPGELSRIDEGLALLDQGEAAAAKAAAKETAKAATGNLLRSFDEHLARAQSNAGRAATAARAETAAAQATTRSAFPEVSAMLERTYRATNPFTKAAANVADDVTAQAAGLADDAAAAAAPSVTGSGAAAAGRRGVSGAEILAGQAVGMGAGGAIGAQFGDTPEERERNMLLGIGLGSMVGTPITGLIHRGMSRFGRVENVASAADDAAVQWQKAKIQQTGDPGLPEARAAADDYMRLAGIERSKAPRVTRQNFDPEMARTTADYFETAQSMPHEPEVQRAYRQFADETRRQYEYLASRGVKFTPVDEAQTYPNSAAMVQDIGQNRRLAVYAGDLDHPLLTPEENWMFRAVHDYFGHGAEGNTFGPIGEENAYRAHSQMYSAAARRAMATETRGQNSWVNFGPPAEVNAAKPGSVYAEQKTFLLPERLQEPTTGAGLPARAPAAGLGERGAVGTPNPLDDFYAQAAVRVRGKDVYTGSDHGLAFFKAKQSGFKGRTDDVALERGFSSGEQFYSPAELTAELRRRGVKLPDNFPADHLTSEEVKALIRGASPDELMRGRTMAQQGQSVTSYFRNLGRGGAVGTVDDAGTAVATAGDDAIREALARGKTAARRGPGYTGPVDVEDFAKLEKFGQLDPIGTQRLEQEIERVVRQEGIAPKTVVSHDAVRAVAQDLGLADVATGDFQALTGEKLLAIRNLVRQNVEHLGRMYDEVAKGAPPSRLQQLDRAIGQLEHENTALLSRFVKARTQKGRDLNSLKIVAAESMSPELWLLKAQNIVEQHGGQLLPEQQRAITGFIQSGDRAGLVQYVAGLRQPSRTSQAVSLWKAGLLTNPKTHLANMASNAAFGAMETAKDAPAALVDRALGMFTGVRSKDFAPVQTIAASARGARRGLAEAKDVLKGVPTEQDLLRWDLPQSATFKNPILRAYTDGVFRSLAAEDKVFRAAAMRRSLEEQARVLAKGNKAVVRQLIDNPSLDMAKQAVADAEYAVFQNRSRLGQAASGLKRPLGPVGDVILPFTQTPANVAMATVDYSPIGALRGGYDVVKLVKAVRGGASEAEIRAIQKAAAERIGRAVTGTSAAVLAGYVLAKNGKMTGARPASKEDRDQWNLAGKQENAVLVNGKWHSLTRLSPLGNLMALGANLYELRQEPGATLTGVAAAGVGSIGTTLSEQSFLSGAQDAAEAVQDLKGAGLRYAKRQAGSVVPAAVRAVARGVDPTIRDTKTLGDEILAGIPGASKSLPAQVDQLGRPKQRDGGVVSQLTDITGAREYKLADPVIREFERTGATLGSLGLGKRKPAEAERLRKIAARAPDERRRAFFEKLADKAEGGETPEDFRGRAAREGQMLDKILSRLVADPRYTRLGDSERKEVLERAVDRIRRAQSAQRRTPRLPR